MRITNQRGALPLQLNVSRFSWSTRADCPWFAIGTAFAPVIARIVTQDGPGQQTGTRKRAHPGFQLSKKVAAHAFVP